MLLSHLLVEFDASLAGRICESESIVFKRASSLTLAHVGGGLQYLVGLCVCLSVCLSVCYHKIAV